MPSKIEDYDFDAEIVNYPPWYDDLDDPNYNDESQSHFCLECDNELHFVDNTDDLMCSECEALYILNENELFIVGEKNE